jgi:hypothetical protein
VPQSDLLCYSHITRTLRITSYIKLKTSDLKCVLTRVVALTYGKCRTREVMVKFVKGCNSRSSLSGMLHNEDNTA